MCDTKQTIRERPPSVNRLDRPLQALALAVALTLPGIAHAQLASPWNEHPNAKVRLIAAEGRMLGVELAMAPGWKTYWRMPGDAGVPPSFDWAGSSNLKSIEVLYPAPASIPDQGGMAIGYKGTVIFPVRVSLDDNTKPTSVTLEFAFGVCKDICIPVESKLTLTLPGGQPWPQSSNLAQFVSRVPKTISLTDAARATPGLLSFIGDSLGATPHLTFTTRGASDLFIEAPDGFFVPMPVETKTSGDNATFRVDLSKAGDAKDLVGRPLRITVIGPAGAIETTVTGR